MTHLTERGHSKLPPAKGLAEGATLLAAVEPTVTAMLILYYLLFGPLGPLGADDLPPGPVPSDTWGYDEYTALLNEYTHDRIGVRTTDRRSEPAFNCVGSK